LAALHGEPDPARWSRIGQPTSRDDTPSRRTPSGHLRRTSAVLLHGRHCPWPDHLPKRLRVRRAVARHQPQRCRGSVGALLHAPNRGKTRSPMHAFELSRHEPRPAKLAGRVPSGGVCGDRLPLPRSSTREAGGGCASEFLDPQIEWRGPESLPWGGTFRGHDGFRQFFAIVADRIAEPRRERSEVNARRLSGGAAWSTRPVVPLKTAPAPAPIRAPLSRNSARLGLARRVSGFRVASSDPVLPRGTDSSERYLESMSSDRRAAYHRVLERRRAVA
jgi:hypothetical protein